MKRQLMEILVDPVSGTDLQLEIRDERDGEIVSGSLIGADGDYAIVDAIPRFVRTEDPGQKQTQASFAFKWTNPAGFGSPGMQQVVGDWIVERYGFTSAAEMRAWFGARDRVLDAGCGAGLATTGWIDEEWTSERAEYVGVDISNAIDVAASRVGDYPRTHFVQADILQLPFRDGVFDAIISEGVLHHTPSTEKAFKSLVRLLAPNGEIMIYVYKRKAPLREFTDDYVRNLVQGLPPEKVWELLRPLTALARELSHLKAIVTVPEDVPLLEIPAGSYDVQRLIYWYFAKMFWNDAMSFEENNHVNFDWYAPTYAHRHTREEVQAWFETSGLEVVRFNEQEAGFTVRGVRR